MNGTRIAPGPRGEVLLGNLRAFRRDVLKLMLDSAKEFGDVVRFRLGPLAVHLINHPDHVEHILQSHARNYDKATRSSAKIRAISGESLLVSNGEVWKRQRRLMQPTFHRHRIGGLATEMVGLTKAMLESWRANHATGRPLNVASEMMRLTYRIVAKTLLGADVGSDSAAVGHAMEIMLAHAYRSWGSVLGLPLSFPTPANLRFRSALKTVDDVVSRIIAQQRVGKGTGDNLLSMLLEVRDEDGRGLSDTELRNETVTFLLAGHETTANALAWTFYLLSQNRAIEEQLRSELAEVLRGRPPGVDDLPKLTFTNMVIQESMRLYPTIWAMERHAIADDVIGGFHIPGGSSVVISPYVLHRNENFWPNPELFDPARFSVRHKAYIPFGSGPRFCIGNEFALMEARLIVPMVLQNFHLELTTNQVIEPLPGITLHPKGGLPMIARPI